jgi:hypothetical protein
MIETNPGLIQDTPDARDYLVSDVLGAKDEIIDWDNGFNIYEELGIPVPLKDQNGSLSCVGQAVAQLFRCLYHEMSGKDVDFSSKFVYSQIFQPQGGASLRDGIKLAADLGIYLEQFIPSYQNGYAPTESYMRDTSWKNDNVLVKAKTYDNFTFRMIPCGTADIEAFAQAIKQFSGLLGGFTGSNNAWCKPLISVPASSDSKWGHAVYLAGYGMYQGKKCLFTPNSWGNRYGIQEGRWKGMQAIPEEYFLASTDTAVGKVAGYLVFNSWALVPDELLTPNQKLMDLLKRLNLQIVQDSEQSGSFGLVKGQKILVATPERLPALIATFIAENFGSGMTAQDWNAAEKLPF